MFHIYFLPRQESCILHLYFHEQKDGGYITPVEAENKHETFISRIRQDDSQSNTMNLWIVSDNLLKGAALNAVEIAEDLIKKNLYDR